MSEQEKVLNMLSEGQITAAEAAELLEALRGTAKAPPAPPKPKSAAKTLHINIESSGDKDEVDLNINVPIGLAKFVNKFLPPEARKELEKQGLDLNEMFSSIDGDFSTGTLFDFNVNSDETEVNIKIEVRQ